MAVISLFVLMAVAMVEETAIAIVSLRGVATPLTPMPCHPNSRAGLVISYCVGALRDACVAFRLPTTASAAASMPCADLLVDGLPLAFLLSAGMLADLTAD